MPITYNFYFDIIFKVICSMQLSYKNNTFQLTSHIKIDYVNNNSYIIEGIEITSHFCQALNNSKYRSSILFNVSWNINILFDINLD